MADIEREAFIGLLEQLGSESDEEALAAARSIDAQIKETGVSWDMLLVPAPGDDDDDDDDDYADDDDDDDYEGPTPIDPASADEDLALIEQLQAADVSDETREELEDYKVDIEEGDFTDADRRYLRALAKRLGI